MNSVEQEMEIMGVQMKKNTPFDERQLRRDEWTTTEELIVCIIFLIIVMSFAYYALTVKVVEIDKSEIPTNSGELILQLNSVEI
jgi:hypothetical protein